MPTRRPPRHSHHVYVVLLDDRTMAHPNQHGGTAESFEVARGEFPTIDPAVLQETLDRSYADDLWEFTGMVTPAAVDTAFAVVRASGVLKDDSAPVQYADVVDMSFMNKAGPTNG